MAELVLTAYDIQKYLQEALPALRAAIYRGDLSQAKDVLLLYDETIYGEYDLSQDLIDGDFSWLFTDEAADPEAMDPEGLLVGLTYPLILAYHRPEIFRMVVGGAELERALPFLTHSVEPAQPARSANPAQPAQPAPGVPLAVQPGFREGLRGMWEIVGYISPDGVKALQAYCRNAEAAPGLPGMPERPPAVARVLVQIGEALTPVIENGYGLVLERD